MTASTATPIAAAPIPVAPDAVTLGGRHTECACYDWHKPVLVLALAFGLSAVARAADSQPMGSQTAQDRLGRVEQPGASDGESPRSFIEIIAKGGPVGWLIIILSVAAVALVIEHVMTIRHSVLIPPGLGEEVYGLLAEGKLPQADQRCRTDPSFLSHVLAAGLAEVDGGWPAVEKAVEDSLAEQSARLFRKIEYLSVIGNIAPMLGLLGTVIGMILAFREVADTQGAARAADLASGIYLALVTTVEGLIVAIPSLAAFAVFRNRVDHLVAEVAYVAQHVFAPLKRSRTSRPARVPAPPPVGRGG